ncbi:hypothetical protein FB451DRAFT_1406201 [Mycena latifolia]|nr:hypothetical protein FB451DRAFT_1406201 [Mycena latifolia]
MPARTDEFRNLNAHMPILRARRQAPQHIQGDLHATNLARNDSSNAWVGPPGLEPAATRVNRPCVGADGAPCRQRLRAQPRSAVLPAKCQASRVRHVPWSSLSPPIELRGSKALKSVGAQMYMSIDCALRIGRLHRAHPWVERRAARSPARCCQGAVSAALPPVFSCRTTVTNADKPSYFDSAIANDDATDYGVGTPVATHPKRTASANASAAKAHSDHSMGE